LKMFQTDAKRDGTLNKLEFDQVIKALLGKPFDADIMGYVMDRYAEFRDERINYFAFLYDLYHILLAQKNRIGEFRDFPIFQPSQENNVMTRFTTIMRKKDITAEKLASELIDLCRSHRLRRSFIMLKVMNIMEDEINTIAKSMGGKLPEGEKHPVARIFEIVDCIDSKDDRGSVMDYDFVTYLNSFLRFEMRMTMEAIVKKLSKDQISLSTYLREVEGKTELIDAKSLRDFLVKKEGYLESGVDHLLEKLGFTKDNSLHINKVQLGFERQLVLLRLIESPIQIKNLVYGTSTGQLDAEQLGVASIIDEIRKKIEQRGAPYEEFFGGGTVTSMIQPDFVRQLTILGVSPSAERSRLLEICDEKSNKRINMYLFKQLYDSRIMSKDGDSFKNSAEALNTTIRNLKTTIKNLGANLAAIFSQADTNRSNSLDQRVSFGNFRNYSTFY